MFSLLSPATPPIYAAPAEGLIASAKGTRTNPPRTETPSLTELGREIDRIDEMMHGLLMERAEIIDRLISAKQTQASGSAFRPAREAEMLRRRVGRHKGILPLD